MDLGDLRCEGVVCIHLAQDRDQWRAVVNTVMNLRFSCFPKFLLMITLSTKCYRT
jgi:hypothetical protein